MKKDRSTHFYTVKNNLEINIDEEDYVLRELMKTIETLQIATTNFTPMYIAGAHWGALQAIEILKKKDTE